jgi:hypothetical protein
MLLQRYGVKTKMVAFATIFHNNNNQTIIQLQPQD